MAPISLKRPSTPSQNITLAGASEARSLVRDAMRTTLVAPLVSLPLAKQISPAELRFGPALVGFMVDGMASKILCCEEVDRRRWSYMADVEPSGSLRTGSSLKAVAIQNPVAPIDELVSFIRSYVVPEGFPDSVTPSYVPYMMWRALKHFFGGAMGVFTTQTLLSSVGVSRNQATSGAVAINWILKLRFAGDLLMELGAGVELATAVVPHLFLTLACAANVAENVAAVTSTSTHTPIYKAFARGENIGDVTAKGESVGNIADLEKFVKARQDVLAREGQGVQIDDVTLWWDIFGVAKNRCYAMGNLVEEITSDYSHLQSQRSTLRTQQSISSMSPEVMSKLEFLEKAYDEQKKQNQYIISLLESRGIQVNLEITPRTSHAPARTRESASHGPHTSEDVEQPQPVDDIATK
ncbi:protein root UVB sensitive 3-like [Dioscorea cayenensis subsp. rotundata]|uniref:Protein root UVB sensitive 3-like n=1 Tax=Dioscorea cayennensis subsp. rotundata TaxID=55577 RepID=A0AB40AY74_DIOCR|nr:protein root UVB sensitive 3-like [Dioscorea cayenensis subsp. rotundata]